MGVTQRLYPLGLSRSTPSLSKYSVQDKGVHNIHVPLCHGLHRECLQNTLDCQYQTPQVDGQELSKRIQQAQENRLRFLNEVQDAAEAASDAVEQFQIAIRLQPDFVEAQDGLRAALNLQVNPNLRGQPAPKP